MRVKELIEILNQLPPETLISILERTIIHDGREANLLLDDQYNSAVITLTHLKDDTVYVSEICQYKKENRVPVKIRDIKHYIRFLSDILQEVERIKAGGELTAEVGYSAATNLTLIDEP